MLVDVLVDDLLVSLLLLALDTDTLDEVSLTTTVLCDGVREATALADTRRVRTTLSGWRAVELERVMFLSYAAAIAFTRGLLVGGGGYAPLELEFTVSGESPCGGVSPVIRY